MNMLRLQRDMMLITRIAYVKEYTRAPMSWFPASSGVMQYNSGARSQASSGTAGYVASNNGGTGVESVRHFASPLYIAGGESLAVDFKPGPGAVTGLDLATDSRMRMRVYMDGYRKRPVA
jgi:hypothetical protein